MGDPERFDLVVVGVGPAGEKAAAQAAYFGKRVAVVERAPEPGGAGVHTGTLPSKTLRESALYLSGHRAREIYGVAVHLEKNATLPRLMDRKASIATSESRRIRDNLERHGVTYVHGEATFVSPLTVRVTGPDAPRLLRGEHVLIATGSRPFRPDSIAFEDDKIHDSDEVLEIERIPESLTILGGGVIGCEYACIFAALGVSVTLVDARNGILPFLDAEIVQRLSEAMQKLGVRLRQGQRWGDVTARGSSVEVELADGARLSSEHVLFAAGRGGNTERLGLADIGVEVDKRGFIKVDSSYRTSTPGVLAAGDVIGFPALASVSMEQGRVAVCRAFGFEYKQSVSELMPYGIYTIPEVGAVGETEQSCAERGIDYVVGRSTYALNARGKITGDLDGMTKLVMDATSRRLLGVHAIGERATELVHVGQTALHLGGTVDLFIDMVFNFPTLAESYKYAAYDCLGKLAVRG
jgi:NAD(P) transhydrogenase